MAKKSSDLKNVTTKRPAYRCLPHPVSLETKKERKTWEEFVMQNLHTIFWKQKPNIIVIHVDAGNGNIKEVFWQGSLTEMKEEEEKDGSLTLISWQRQSILPQEEPLTCLINLPFSFASGDVIVSVESDVCRKYLVPRNRISFSWLSISSMFGAVFGINSLLFPLLLDLILIHVSSYCFLEKRLEENVWMLNQFCLFPSSWL